MAVIKVGAATETEMKEKKARVEDAMHATKAAVEEGIVPGGGVALIRAGKALDSLKLEGDQAVGVALIRKAIEEPLRWIATNAGQEGSIVVSRVKEAKGEEGYNAFSDKYENLVAAGVIDPVKVVRTALQNASSIASLLLTTEALVTEIPEDKKDAPAMPGGGGMGGMYLVRSASSFEVRETKAGWEQSPPAFSFQGKTQLDVDPDGDRLAILSSRLEPPVLDRPDRLLVQPILGVERTGYPYLTDFAVRQHHHLQPDDALNVSVLGRPGVIRTGVPSNLWILDARARAVSVGRLQWRTADGWNKGEGDRYDQPGDRIRSLLNRRGHGVETCRWRRTGTLP